LILKSFGGCFIIGGQLGIKVLFDKPLFRCYDIFVAKEADMNNIARQKELFTPAGRLAIKAGITNETPVRPIIENLIKGFIELVYPKICLSCKKPLGRFSIDNYVCLGCWANIKMNLPPFCRRCSRTLKKQDLAKNICRECLKKDVHFDRAFSPCVYEGTIKELIHQCKYGQKEYLAQTFAKLLAGFIKEYRVPVDNIDYIIPVPLHKAKLRQREFNQAEILCRFIGKDFNKPVIADNLFRCRQSRSQTELKPQARFLNVKDSFAVIEKDSLKGKNILLVDDVLTTGATASEASLALKNAGAMIVFVLTVAT
jgi:ComF family protein